MPLRMGGIRTVAGILGDYHLTTPQMPLRMGGIRTVAGILGDYHLTTPQMPLRMGGLSNLSRSLNQNGRPSRSHTPPPTPSRPSATAATPAARGDGAAPTGASPGSRLAPPAGGASAIICGHRNSVAAPAP